MFSSELREVSSDLKGEWWAFLVFAIAWFVIAIVVLRLDLTSVVTVGILLGASSCSPPSRNAQSPLFDGAVGGSSTSSLASFFASGAIWCFIAPF